MIYSWVTNGQWWLGYSKSPDWSRRENVLRWINEKNRWPNKELKSQVVFEDLNQKQACCQWLQTWVQQQNQFGLTISNISVRCILKPSSVVHHIYLVFKLGDHYPQTTLRHFAHSGLCTTPLHNRCYCVSSMSYRFSGKSSTVAALWPKSPKPY